MQRLKPHTSPYGEATEMKRFALYLALCALPCHSASGLDIVAMDIRLQTQAGNLPPQAAVRNPEAGQSLYVHFYYFVIYSPEDDFADGTLAIELNGDTICDATVPLLPLPGPQAVWCSTRVEIAPGVLTFKGTADPGNTLEETNEDNNIWENVFNVEGHVPTPTPPPMDEDPSVTSEEIFAFASAWQEENFSAQHLLDLLNGDLDL